METKEGLMKKGMITLSVCFIFCIIFPLKVHAEKPLEIVKAQVDSLLNVLSDPALKAKSQTENRARMQG